MGTHIQSTIEHINVNIKIYSLTHERKHYIYLSHFINLNISKQNYRRQYISIGIVCLFPEPIHLILSINLKSRFQSLFICAFNIRYKRFEIKLQ